MPIVDLIVAVCLAADPTSCHDEHLLFESHGSLRACMMEAIPAVAQWSGNHPEWRIVKFHCEWAGQEEQKT